MFSHAHFLATPWIVAHQAPLSVEFSRQEYWSGLTFPTPEDFPDPGIKSPSPAANALAGGFSTTAPPGKPKVGWGNTSVFLFTEVQHLF